MSEGLKQLIGEAQSRFQSEPESAVVTFESQSALQQGLRSEAALRGHRLVVDEPPALGGTDAGPNPVELILAALGTCQEITYRAFATALGIPLDRVSVQLTGTIDLKGFFAVDDAVRPGYEKIAGVVKLESTASDEQLEMLRNAVNAHCPVLDILKNPVPVTLDMEIGGRPPWLPSDRLVVRDPLPGLGRDDVVARPGRCRARTASRAWRSPQRAPEIDEDELSRTSPYRPGDPRS